MLIAGERLLIFGMYERILTVVSSDAHLGAKHFLQATRDRVQFARNGSRTGHRCGHQRNNNMNIREAC